MTLVLKSKSFGGGPVTAVVIGLNSTPLRTTFESRKIGAQGSNFADFAPLAANWRNAFFRCANPLDLLRVTAVHARRRIGIWLKPP